MSRRTRIKRDIRKLKFGLNHHNQYSSSATYFPSSYSLYGSPIEMPERILHLNDNNNINYVCQPQQLLSVQCPLLLLTSQELSNAKSFNVTVAGLVIQKYKSFITKCVVFISLSLCCILAVFASPCFRRKFFTRYTTTIQQYRALGDRVRHLKTCENMIINIQDNQLTKQKAQILENSILQSQSLEGVLQNDNQINTKSRKKVTIRNFCYFMNDIDYKSLFPKLMACQQIQALFIWEKKKLTSAHYVSEDGESQSLIKPIFGC